MYTRPAGNKLLYGCITILIVCIKDDIERSCAGKSTRIFNVVASTYKSGGQNNLILKLGSLCIFFVISLSFSRMLLTQSPI